MLREHGIIIAEKGASDKLIWFNDSDNNKENHKAIECIILVVALWQCI